ncbi:MAG: BON domain-containing protein [Coleofasciculus sp. S288]|nr:BON domain-containing protein [Coleofasciculus sp. S288]
MKKLTSVFLSGILLLIVGACAARTSTQAPTTTEASPEAPEPDEAQQNQEDATSELRRRQLNSDIRAREERNQIAGDTTERAEGDLESEVRSKLEANLPASSLLVEAEEDGSVVVTGTVPTQEQLARIEPLAKEIKGVQNVAVKATVAPAKPEAE